MDRTKPDDRVPDFERGFVSVRQQIQIDVDHSRALAGYRVSLSLRDGHEPRPTTLRCLELRQTRPGVDDRLLERITRVALVSKTDQEVSIEVGASVANE